MGDLDIYVRVTTGLKFVNQQLYPYFNRHDNFTVGLNIRKILKKSPLTFVQTSRDVILKIQFSIILRC